MKPASNNSTFLMLFTGIVMAGCLVIPISLRSQNVSYNSNSVGIGGNFNTAIGYQNLLSNASNMNTAVGYQSLFSNTTASHNTAIGIRALYTNSTGSFNTALAAQALNKNTTGYNNTAAGINALYYNTTGFNNTATGALALITNTTGNNNTGIGTNSLYLNNTGNSNTALGYEAGYSSVGDNNTFIGFKAGKNETRNYKLYISGDSANTLLYGDFLTGQILLGKKDPVAYTFKGSRTLNVLGGILADSVRVSLSGQWADYVFDPAYPLLPLDQLEQYVQLNRHLPGLPSAYEVSNNGIELGTISNQLLEKIEELYLYIIRLQKTIDQLKAEK